LIWCKYQFKTMKKKTSFTINIVQEGIPFGNNTVSPLLRTQESIEFKVTFGNGTNMRAWCMVSLWGSELIANDWPIRSNLSTMTRIGSTCEDSERPSCLLSQGLGVCA
jgi:hypothetical protein